MNTASKGNAGENRVAAHLEAQGYVVGLRRNRRGGGDLLAARFDVALQDWTVRLVEVKASSVKRGPYADFPPKDRAELLATATALRAIAELAWTPTPGRIEFRQPTDWP